MLTLFEIGLERDNTQSDVEVKRGEGILQFLRPETRIQRCSLVSLADVAQSHVRLVLCF